MDIPIPSHGEPMRVSWGAAVAQSINALRSIGGEALVTESPQGSGARPLPGNKRDQRAIAYRHPFELRWFDNVGTIGAVPPEPGFAVYLPDLAKLVFMNGAYVSIAGMTVLDGRLGWYETDISPTEGGDLYLVITETLDSGGEVSSVAAAIDTAAGTDSTGTRVTNIKLATCSISDESGLEINQLVDSLVSIGGASDPTTVTGTDGHSETGTDFTFQAADYTNLTAIVSKDAQTGKVTITLGVFYV